MMSMFSPFDYLIFYKNSAVFFTFLITFSNLVFKISMSNHFFNMIKSFFSTFFHSLKKKKFNKTSLFIKICTFVMLFFMNFCSIFSYNFPYTSQFSMVMFISLVFWFSLQIFMVLNSAKNLIQHLVPEGAPLYLVWFLFMVEFISNLIRPLTLTIRLVANITAGHLVLILLSSIVLKMPFFMVFYLILNTIEIFVALIQSYIFSTMIVLYFSEV